MRKVTRIIEGLLIHFIYERKTLTAFYVYIRKKIVCDREERGKINFWRRKLDRDEFIGV